MKKNNHTSIKSFLVLAIIVLCTSQVSASEVIGVLSSSPQENTGTSANNASTQSSTPSSNQTTSKTSSATSTSTVTSKSKSEPVAKEENGAVLGSSVTNSDAELYLTPGSPYDYSSSLPGSSDAYAYTPISETGESNAANVLGALGNLSLSAWTWVMLLALVLTAIAIYEENSRDNTRITGRL